MTENVYEVREWRLSRIRDGVTMVVRHDLEDHVWEVEVPDDTTTHEEAQLLTWADNIGQDLTVPPAGWKVDGVRTKLESWMPAP